jgi:FKBP-type peptidyl-prolyl cis-trans isomerase
MDMSLKRDRKLVKVTIKRGNGWSTPLNGDEVKVHLIANLKDGTVVESTRDRNQAFSFTVGRKQVVIGLDIGIKTIKCAQIAKFTTDSEFAYGTNGCLPSVQWKRIDITNKTDGCVRKRMITPEVAYYMPESLFAILCL